VTLISNLAEPQKLTMVQLLRRYAITFAAVSRWRLWCTLALMVVASLTEGFGLALMLPTLQLAGVDIGGHSEAGRFAAWVRADLAAVGLHPTLFVMLGLFVAVVCVRALLSTAQGVATTVLYERFAQHLRQSLFEAISGAQWRFICRSRSSDFVHALTNEVDRAAMAAHQGLFMLSGAVIGSLYVTASLVIFPAATLLMLGLSAVLIVLLRARTRAVFDTGSDYSDVAGSVYGTSIEHFQGLKTAKMYGAQRRTCELFARLTRDMARASVAMTREQLTADAWFEVGCALMMGVVLAVAIKLLKITPAEVLILLILFVRLVPQVRSLQSSYRGTIGLLPGFATVTGLEDRCRAAAEPDVVNAAPLKFHSGIRFEKVSFSYQGGADWVLRDLDLMIPAGRTTAIVGPSGAGKSTIADLLMGLIAPDAGRIMVDGASLDARLAGSWRESIGYVAQDTFLFHDTVRANLLWARPNASESELRDVLAMAAAGEFVARLPQGLDTVVGDRGATISQGERQRLALARALLRRPRLLVLDEATNSLDSENETKILASIERIREGVAGGGGVTTVLIAHRLSTIRWADLIYVIESGRVVESGDWTTLSAKLDGRFRSWCVAQGLAA
jgi:ATP-binding cassette, subfamily C, bacterial